MAECLDHNVGSVVDYLESTDEPDIMFMSDNGAEGAAYEASPIVKGPLMEHLGQYSDNSIENIGTITLSFGRDLGGQAATAPSHLYKAYSVYSRGRCLSALHEPTPKTANQRGRRYFLRR